MRKRLPLHQEFMLLAIRDTEGTMIGFSYGSLLPNAILAELSLQKRIKISGKDLEVTILSSAPTGDEALDKCLNIIAKEAKTKPASTWLMKFASDTKLSQTVIRQLCDRQILREVTHRWLGLFPYKRYPLIADNVERDIRTRMRKLMFGQTIQHDARTTILISLAKIAGLLKPNFDADRIVRNENRISKIAKGDMFAARAPRADQIAIGPTVTMSGKMVSAG